jgi:hypothetical protein
MYDSPDNPTNGPDIDGLFRNLAQHYEPPYDPAAWQQMRHRLDALPSARPTPVRLLLLILAVAFLAGSEQQSRPGTAPDRAAAAGSAGVAGLPVPRPSDPVSSRPAHRLVGLNRTDLSPSTALDASLAVVSGSVSRQVPPIVKDTIISGQARPKSSGRRTMFVLQKTRATPRMTEKQADVSTTHPDEWLLDVPTLTPVNEADPVTDRSVVCFVLPDSAVTTTLAVVPAQPDSALTVLPVVGLDSGSVVAESGAPARVRRPVTGGRVSVLMLVSPDATAGRGANFVQPGTNVGLLLEYRLARRWSVLAGVIRSKKLYYAPASQPADWKLTMPFEAVAGRCDLYDLPVNVRFDLMRGRSRGAETGHRVFASAGLTTYIMVREKYDYIYANPTDQRIQFRDWQGETGRYTFSHANFSVGYERRLADRWAVQAEPFVKVPLGGVGIFRVNVISTGVFLGLRYRL